MQPAMPQASPRPETLGVAGYEKREGGNELDWGEIVKYKQKATWWHGHGHDDETRLMMCLSIRARLTDWGSVCTTLHPKRVMRVGGLCAYYGLDEAEAA